MKKIKIKYCGLRTLEDVQSAVTAQVDAIGLVFVKKSRRFISLPSAAELSIAAKQSGLKVVALFADHNCQAVENVIQVVEPDLLQFHGNESAEFCSQFGRAFWKAIPMLETQNYQAYMNQYPDAEAFLLDAFGGTQTGGSGESFKWFEFPAQLAHKLILAGGINACNVASAIAATGAQFIDTSSGIETVPGVKSKNKMLALAKQIQSLSESIDSLKNNN